MQSTAIDQQPAGELVQVKIVYWGPAESGKTTSLFHVAKTFAKYRADDLIAVQTTTGRTLWSEYGAFCFPMPAGGRIVQVVVHLSATTGQERFLNTREYAASRADGAIFIADCRPEYFHLTKRSFEELVAFLPPAVPVVVEANFQDIKGAASPSRVESLMKSIAPGRWRGILPTIASSGVNVAPAFTTLLLAILTNKPNGR